MRLQIRPCKTGTSGTASRFAAGAEICGHAGFLRLLRITERVALYRMTNRGAHRVEQLADRRLARATPQMSRNDICVGNPESADEPCMDACPTRRSCSRSAPLGGRAFRRGYCSRPDVRPIPWPGSTMGSRSDRTTSRPRRLLPRNGSMPATGGCYARTRTIAIGGPRLAIRSSTS